ERGKPWRRLLAGERARDDAKLAVRDVVRLDRFDERLKLGFVLELRGPVEELRHREKLDESPARRREHFAVFHDESLRIPVRVADDIDADLARALVFGTAERAENALPFAVRDIDDLRGRRDLKLNQSLFRAAPIDRELHILARNTVKPRAGASALRGKNALEE